MHIVIDTNVLVSAILSRSSTPGKVFDLVLENHVFLASKESCAEIENVIWREKLAPYSTPDERRIFFTEFINKAKTVKISETISVCRDPKDNMILELAVSGDADYIITGDKDLLELNPFRGIQILKPTRFLVLHEK